MAAFAAAAFCFLASARATCEHQNLAIHFQKKKPLDQMHTFSASSFCLASSSAFRFSSSISSFVFFTGALVVPRFLASRASFSCCLIRLIRGSRLQSVRNSEDECHHLQVPEGRVYQVTEFGNVFLFSPGAFRLIFLFCISFVITATKRYQ